MVRVWHTTVLLTSSGPHKSLSYKSHIVWLSWKIQRGSWVPTHTDQGEGIRPCSMEHPVKHTLYVHTQVCKCHPGPLPARQTYASKVKSTPHHRQSSGSKNHTHLAPISVSSPSSKISKLGLNAQHYSIYCPSSIGCPNSMLFLID